MTLNDVLWNPLNWLWSVHKHIPIEPDDIFSESALKPQHLSLSLKYFDIKYINYLTNTLSTCVAKRYLLICLLIICILKYRGGGHRVVEGYDQVLITSLRGRGSYSNVWDWIYEFIQTVH